MVEHSPAERVVAGSNPARSFVFWLFFGLFFWSLFGLGDTYNKEKKKKKKKHTQKREHTKTKEEPKKTQHSEKARTDCVAQGVRPAPKMRS